MGNRIPRAATKLEVEFLTDTSAGKSGIKMIAEKMDHGWVGTCGDKSYHLFTQHLRNEHYCSINVIS